MRVREVRKLGSSWFIKLEPADVKDFKLKIGDRMDLDDALKLVKRKRK